MNNQWGAANDHNTKEFRFLESFIIKKYWAGNLANLYSEDTNFESARATAILS
jgi:hypothetical protein